MTVNGFPPSCLLDANTPNLGQEITQTRWQIPPFLEFKFAIELWNGSHLVSLPLGVVQSILYGRFWNYLNIIPQSDSKMLPILTFLFMAAEFTRHPRQSPPSTSAHRDSSGHDSSLEVNLLCRKVSSKVAVRYSVRLPGWITERSGKTGVPPQFLLWYTSSQDASTEAVLRIPARTGTSVFCNVQGRTT